MTRKSFSFMLYYEHPNAIFKLALLWVGGEGGWTRDLQMSLPNSAIPWFCSVLDTLHMITTAFTIKLISEKHGKEQDDKYINT